MHDMQEWIDRWEDMITQYIGEVNNVTTRYILADRLNDHLESLDEVEHYRVVCDEHNNTAQTIDQNAMIVDITLAFLCADPMEINFVISSEYNPYCWYGTMDEPVAQTDYLAITREIVNGS